MDRKADEHPVLLEIPGRRYFWLLLQNFAGHMEDFFFTLTFFRLPKTVQKSL